MIQQSAWEIGRGEEYEDLGYQDHVESEDIYETLERSIAPLFYDRGASGLPDGWIAKMKASLRKLSPIYTTERMVREYAESYYVPAARRAVHVAQNEYALAKSLVEWKRKMRLGWQEVRVLSVTVRKRQTPRRGVRPHRSAGAARSGRFPRTM